MSRTISFEDPYAGHRPAVRSPLFHRQGGRIWFDSREGEGSTFHFTLPDAAR